MSKVRWGHLYEVKHVKRVGDQTWKRLPRRLKHLTAWRRMHMQAKGHRSVSSYGRRYGYSPSSDLHLSRSVGSKLAYLKKKKLMEE